jgi:hypothetical protein
MLRILGLGSANTESLILGAPHLMAIMEFIAAAAAVAIVCVWDDHRGRKAKLSNLDHRCAKCGKILGEKSGLIDVAGGAASYCTQALACEKCVKSTRTKDKILRSLAVVICVGLTIWIEWLRHSG